MLRVRSTPCRRRNCARASRSSKRTDRDEVIGKGGAQRLTQVVVGQPVEGTQVKGQGRGHGHMMQGTTFQGKPSGDGRKAGGLARKSRLDGRWMMPAWHEWPAWVPGLRWSVEAPRTTPAG